MFNFTAITSVPPSTDLQFYLYELKDDSQLKVCSDYKKIRIPPHELTLESTFLYERPIVYLYPSDSYMLPSALKVDQAFNDFLQFSAAVMSLNPLESLNPLIESNRADRDPIKYLESSANKGYPVAQFALANLCKKGQGVRRNLKKATNLYEAASNKNFAPAQNMMGYFYEKGIHKPHDLEMAVQCWVLAANQGFAPAQLKLAEILLKGGDIVEDPMEALEYVQLAVKQEFPPALLKLSEFYEYGFAVTYRDGIQKDLELAFHYLLLAEKQNIERHDIWENVTAFLMRNGNQILQHLDSIAGRGNSLAEKWSKDISGLQEILHRLR